MPRNEDEESGRGGRSAASVRGAGHGASGGHNRGPGRAPGSRSALAVKNRPLWDHLDPDHDSGGDMQTTWQEYPKHVYPWPEEPKRFVQVNNADEERVAMEQGTVVRDEDERKRLIALAGVKSVQVDGRWSIAKLSKAIEDAGFDASANPFE